MSTQTAKVVMLPTKDITAPIWREHMGEGYGIIREVIHNPSSYAKYKDNVLGHLTRRHIHFTTDEPIQKGDWIFEQSEWGVKSVCQSMGNWSEEHHLKYPNDKKIVASTDPALGLREIPSTWIKDVFIPSNGSIKEVKLHTNIMAGGTPIINVNDNFEVIIEHTTSDKDIEEAATKS